jgi:hypothetical protein
MQSKIYILCTKQTRVSNIKSHVARIEPSFEFHRRCTSSKVQTCSFGFLLSATGSYPYRNERSESES